MQGHQGQRFLTTKVFEIVGNDLNKVAVQSKNLIAIKTPTTEELETGLEKFFQQLRPEEIPKIVIHAHGSVVSPKKECSHMSFSLRPQLSMSSAHFFQILHDTMVKAEKLNPTGKIQDKGITLHLISCHGGGSIPDFAASKLQSGICYTYIGPKHTMRGDFFGGDKLYNVDLDPVQSIAYSVGNLANFNITMTDSKGGRISFPKTLRDGFSSVLRDSLQCGIRLPELIKIVTELKDKMPEDAAQIFGVRIKERFNRIIETLNRQNPEFLKRQGYTLQEAQAVFQAQCTPTYMRERLLLISAAILDMEDTGKDRQKLINHSADTKVFIDYVKTLTGIDITEFQGRNKDGMMGKPDPITLGHAGRLPEGFYKILMQDAGEQPGKLSAKHVTELICVAHRICSKDMLRNDPGFLNIIKAFTSPDAAKLSLPLYREFLQEAITLSPAQIFAITSAKNLSEEFLSKLIRVARRLNDQQIQALTSPDAMSLYGQSKDRFDMLVQKASELSAKQIRAMISLKGQGLTPFTDDELKILENANIRRQVNQYKFFPEIESIGCGMELDTLKGLIQIMQEKTELDAAQYFGTYIKEKFNAFIIRLLEKKDGLLKSEGYTIPALQGLCLDRTNIEYMKRRLLLISSMLLRGQDRVRLLQQPLADDVAIVVDYIKKITDVDITSSKQEELAAILVRMSAMPSESFDLFQKYASVLTIDRMHVLSMFLSQPASQAPNGVDRRLQSYLAGLTTLMSSQQVAQLSLMQFTSLVKLAKDDAYDYVSERINAFLSLNLDGLSEGKFCALAKNFEHHDDPHFQLFTSPNVKGLPEARFVMLLAQSPEEPLLSLLTSADGLNLTDSQYTKILAKIPNIGSIGTKILISPRARNLPDDQFSVLADYVAALDRHYSAQRQHKANVLSKIATSIIDQLLQDKGQTNIFQKAFQELTSDDFINMVEHPDEPLLSAQLVYKIDPNMLSKLYADVHLTLPQDQCKMAYFKKALEKLPADNFRSLLKYLDKLSSMAMQYLILKGNSLRHDLFSKICEASAGFQLGMTTNSLCCSSDIQDFKGRMSNHKKWYLTALSEVFTKWDNIFFQFSEEDVKKSLTRYHEQDIRFCFPDPHKYIQKDDLENRFKLASIIAREDLQLSKEEADKFFQALQKDKLTLHNVTKTKDAQQGDQPFLQNFQNKRQKLETQIDGASNLGDLIDIVTTMDNTQSQNHSLMQEMTRCFVKSVRSQEKGQQGGMMK